MTENPEPVRAGGVAVWDNKIYSFGGNKGNGSYSDKLYVYDVELNEWSEVSTIPFVGETKGEVVNGKLYIIGGYNGSVSNFVDVYNIASDTWESRFELPIGYSAHATSVVGDKVFLVGDFSNLMALASFDTADNSFEMLSSNLKPRRHCAAEGIDGSLYAIGGNTESSILSSISSVQRADLLTSLEDVIGSNLFEVYPNPSNDVINLSSSFDELSLYSFDGALLAVYNDVDIINVSKLPIGVYYLKGIDDSKILNSKFVKD